MNRFRPREWLGRFGRGDYGENSYSSTAESSLCKRCQRIFKRPGRHRPDEKLLFCLSPTRVETAAQEGCYICSVLSIIWQDPDWFKKLRKVLLSLPTVLPQPESNYPIYPVSWSYTLLREHNMTCGSYVINFHQAHRQPALHFYLTPEAQSPCQDHKASEEGFCTVKSNLAHRWSSQCTDAHSFCRTYRQENRHYPRRILNVDGLDTIKLELIEKHGLEQPYLTLSHCWGTSNLFRLTRDSSSKLMAGFPISDLPKTFRDAIRITKSIGFKYLWIDALCIYQDSEEDWISEAGSMGSIYSGGAFNIAATASADNQVGCFRSSHMHYQLPVVYPSWATNNPAQSNGLIINSESSFGVEIIKSPLLSRSWVHQELHISPATLHFARNQMWWVCQGMVANETYPNGLPKEISPQSFNGRNSFKECLVKHSQSISASSEIMNLWFTIIRHYSHSSTTKPDDRLVAISGIVNLLRPLLAPDVLYCCGIWSCLLLDQLLWRAEFITHRHREDRYAIPTWSWASVVSEAQGVSISLKDNYFPLVEVVFFGASNIDQFGRVGSKEDGILLLLGYLIPVGLPSLLDRKGGWPIIGGLGIPHVWIDSVEDRDELKEIDRSYYFLPMLEEGPLRHVSGLILWQLKGGKSWHRCGCFMSGDWDRTGAKEQQNICIV